MKISEPPTGVEGSKDALFLTNLQAFPRHARPRAPFCDKSNKNKAIGLQRPEKASLDPLRRLHFCAVLVSVGITDGGTGARARGARVSGNAFGKSIV